MERITRLLRAVLSSKRFGAVVLALFVVQALWVALSAAYPMAFDEDFHLGVIKVYSEQWSPFFSGNPADTSQFGALNVDPSYLFHYLFSFPYRFLHLFTQNETVVIIIFRLVNVAMFTLGLVLFYKFLRRVGASRLLANTALTLFTLIPIVPLLAGQINYDNMLFPLVAWTCWLVLYITNDARKQKVDVKKIGVLVAVVLFSCMVKYAYLPVAMGVFFYLVVLLWRKFRGHGAQFTKQLGNSYKALGVWAKFGLLTLVLVGAGLFIQRYGMNMVRYHSPVPECGAALSTQECMLYGPWARDHLLAQNTGVFNHSPLYFTKLWLDGMQTRLFFMVAGPVLGFETHQPLPIISGTAIALAVLLLAALCVWGWKLLRHNVVLTFLLVITALYALVLWVNGYGDYLHTGQPVAINGRYFVLVLFPFFAVAGLALAQGLKKYTYIKPWLAAAAILLFLQGGGVTSFILRSNPRWDWQNNTVIQTNNAARNVLKPLIIEGED
jgi:hypothetical protein